MIRALALAATAVALAACGQKGPLRIPDAPATPAPAPASTTPVAPAAPAGPPSSP